MPSKDDRKWFEDGFDGLLVIATKSRHIQPSVVEEVRGWTLLKQVAFYKALGTYLTLVGPKRWRKIYIDTHASCGINRLDKRELVAGSALIHAGARTKFDHYYFVETDAEKRNALLERLPVYLPADRFTVLKEPAARSVPNIFANESGPTVHSYTVVDPYKLGQMTWEAFETLMSKPRGDLWINFPTTEVKRHHDGRALGNFIGDHEGVAKLLDEDAREDDFLSLFVARLRALRPKTETIRVKSGAGRFYYDLIYAAAETEGGSPWMNATGDVKKRVERLDGTAALESVRSGRIDSY